MSKLSFKNKKSAPTKAVIGGGSKLPKKKMLLLGLPVLVFLAVGGFFGNKYYQQQRLEAAAAGWTQIGTWDGGVFYACKTYVNSPYGALWRVTTIMIGGNSSMKGEFQVMRGSSLVNQTNHTVAARQWGRLQYNFASVPLGDYSQGTLGSGSKGGFFELGMNQITNC